jgi:hypothetical protein
LNALRQGANGKIAITYFEWAGQFDQKVILPWRLIDRPEASDAIAAEIARAPYRRASRTSISGALRFAKPLFDESGYKGLRRVIDVSGDGVNNAGPLSCRCAMKSWLPASPLTACRSCSRDPMWAPWISITSTSTTKIV